MAPSAAAAPRGGTGSVEYCASLDLCVGRVGGRADGTREPQLEVMRTDRVGDCLVAVDHGVADLLHQVLIEGLHAVVLALGDHLVDLGRSALRNRLAHAVA